MFLHQMQWLKLTQFCTTKIFANFFLLVNPDTPMLPSSLMLLNTAHEYLGRRSWCCNSDGALLKFYVSVSIVQYGEKKTQPSGIHMGSSHLKTVY